MDVVGPELLLEDDAANAALDAGERDRGGAVVELDDDGDSEGGCGKSGRSGWTGGVSMTVTMGLFFGAIFGLNPSAWRFGLPLTIGPWTLNPEDSASSSRDEAAQNGPRTSNIEPQSCGTTSWI